VRAADEPTSVSVQLIEILVRCDAAMRFVAQDGITIAFEG